MTLELFYNYTEFERVLKKEDLRRGLME